jgi:hypothetical protein
MRRSKIKTILFITCAGVPLTPPPDAAAANSAPALEEARKVA